MKKSAFLLVVFCLICAEKTVAQQALSKEQLINSLQNSATASGEVAKPLDVDALRSSLRNGLTVEPTEEPRLGSGVKPNSEVAAAIEGRPSVNILIYFDYDSASIKPESIPDLMTLGSALNSGKLEGNRFLVAGHTDGKGDRNYNLKLSERRSESVIKFLSATFPGLSGRLLPLGFGMEQLKDPRNPLDPSNRRVQVLNIGS